MPLGCCWTQPWPTRQQTNTTPPATRRACVFPSAACACFINSRAALKAPPGRKLDIHWSNETLFWAFTFTLFYGDLCVCTAFTRSLERFQPASIWWLLFFAVVAVVSAKITTGSQGSVVWRKRSCCWVTMLSQKCPGNVGLHIRPANSCATVLSPCSQTAAATLESTCGGISARWWTRY